MSFKHWTFVCISIFRAIEIKFHLRDFLVRNYSKCFPLLLAICFKPSYTMAGEGRPVFYRLSYPNKQQLIFKQFLNLRAVTLALFGNVSSLLCACSGMCHTHSLSVGRFPDSASFSVPCLASRPVTSVIVMLWRGSDKLKDKRERNINYSCHVRA